MKTKISILFIAVLIQSSFSQNFFQKNTTNQLVNSSSSCYACAWCDYDNDGYLDVAISGSSITCGPCNLPILLYHNNGDGTFTRVTTGPIANYVGTTFGLAWGDYDNDGRPDLYVCTYIYGHNLLFHNEGNGNFTQVNMAPIVPADSTFSKACAWADYDRDGWLDLFIANDDYKDDMLFHNNGNGTFTQITTGQIVNYGEEGETCSWADFNNDGWPDLYLVNHVYNGPDHIYSNNGDGTFTSLTPAQLPFDNQSGMSVSIGDFDNDGLLDILLTADGPVNEPPTLYHNMGNNHFQKVLNYITNLEGRTYGSSWGDYDNDGNLDLFITRCDNDLNLLYRNTGTDFVRIKREIPGQEYSSLGRGYMCSWVDYNNNGKLNLFVLNTDGPNSNYLYNNIGSTGNYLTCKLIGGCGSNKMAIGARISVYAGSLHQIREVSGGTGMGGEDSPWPHFGLGTHTMIDSLIVSWPAGSAPKIQKLVNVPANQMLTIEECLLGVEQNSAPVKFALEQNYPNPFNPVTRIGYSLAKNSHVNLTIYDITGRIVKELVNADENMGTHAVSFDGTNLASGIYIYRITTEQFSDVKKMVLIK